MYRTICFIQSFSRLSRTECNNENYCNYELHVVFYTILNIKHFFFVWLRQSESSCSDDNSDEGQLNAKGKHNGRQKKIAVDHWADVEIDVVDKLPQRYADCKGSQICENVECPFRIEYGIFNTKQFEKKKLQGMVCKGCGKLTKFLKCTARRFVSYRKTSVKVNHSGHHSCPVIHRVKK